MEISWNPVRECEACGDTVIVHRSASDFEPYIAVTKITGFNSTLHKILSLMRRGIPIEEFYHEECWEEIVQNGGADGDTQ
ncbi:hypothetical protein [Halopiger thermotolerans]